jgi:riboflavin synthase
MFTGIIEELGLVSIIEQDNQNVHFTINSPISGALKVDQSVAHNGVCLTVIVCNATSHTVTAISETINKTNLAHWAVGSLINLERCMPANGRFDGHIVQGHVDQTAVCSKVSEEGGSWRYTFSYNPAFGNMTVEKGSICINGVSLTVVDSGVDFFSVAIIPYTYEHTQFKMLRQGDLVNLEFDIVGKYIKRLMGR